MRGAVKQGHDSDMNQQEEDLTGNGSTEDTFPPEAGDNNDDEDLDDFDGDAVIGPEFRAINTAMDQLMLALDALESHNDGIHEGLLELLQSNKEMRQAFTQDVSTEDGLEPRETELNKTCGKGSDEAGVKESSAVKQLPQITENASNDNITNVSIEPGLQDLKLGDNLCLD